MLSDRVHQFLGSSDGYQSTEVTGVEGDVVKHETPAVHDGRNVGENLDRRHYNCHDSLRRKHGNVAWNVVSDSKVMYPVGGKQHIVTIERLSWSHRRIEV